MTAPALIEVPTDSMATLRAMNRMRRAGFTLRLDGNALVVSPADNLSDPQRVFIRAHRPALLALLQDAAELHAALALAGNAGLDWREGMPGWNDDRLLAAGEVLYSDGRMVNRNGRRYLREHAPPIPDPVPDPVPDRANIIPMDREAYEERAAIMEYDGGLSRGESEQKALALALRSAEPQAAGWAPSNAKARAESESLPGWETTP